MKKLDSLPNQYSRAFKHNDCHDINLYHETPKISSNDGNGIPLGNFSLVRKKLEPCKKLFIVHLTKRIL